MNGVVAILHAVIHRKARIRLQDTRSPVEDTITSTIFGLLNYVPPGDAWLAVARLLEIQNPPWGPAVPDEVVVEFWPKMPSSYRARYVEPDVRISAKQARKSVGEILIEVKWEAELGSDQLIAQWFSLAEAARERTVHVALTLDAAGARHAADQQLEKAGSERGRWESHLVVVAWHDFCRNLDGLSGIGALGRWRRDVQSFLLQLGVAPFVGFRTERYGELLPIQSLYSARYLNSVACPGSVQGLYRP